MCKFNDDFIIYIYIYIYRSFNLRHFWTIEMIKFALANLV